jgi:hypothetical protein
MLRLANAQCLRGKSRGGRSTIEPFSIVISASVSRPASISNGLGIITPRELPILRIAVFIEFEIVEVITMLLHQPPDYKRTDVGGTKDLPNVSDP